MSKRKVIFLIFIIIIGIVDWALLYFIRGLCPSPIDLDSNNIETIKIKDTKNGGEKIILEKEEWPKFLKKMGRIKYKSGEYHENFVEDFEVIIEYKNGSVVLAAFYSDRKPQALVVEYTQSIYELYFYDADMFDYLFEDNK